MPRVTQSILGKVRVQTQACVMPEPSTATPGHLAGELGARSEDKGLKLRVRHR